MNIAAANAQGHAAPSRMDATTNDGPSDGDAAAPAGDAAQDFGHILSTTVSKDSPKDVGAELADGRTLNPSAVDPKSLVPDAGVAVAALDQPVTPGLTALLGGRTDSSKGIGSDPATRAKSTDDGKDPAGDDLSAQLAMLSQWAVPNAAIAKASTQGGVTDPAGATHGLSSAVPGQRTVGSTLSAGSRTLVARADAVSGTATGAAVDAALSQGAVAAAAFDMASFVAARSARPVNASGIDATTAKANPSKPDDAARLSSQDSITAAIEKVFNVAMAGTAAAAPDAGSIANPFVTQIAANVSNAPGSLASIATASSALRETVATPAWSHELGQAAIRMATDDLQHASLRLNPEHLGPLDVQMRIDNGIAHMQFTAMHADTRAALEGSRATLDQMFGDQGLKLGDWSVGNSSSNSSFARQFGSAASEGDGSRASHGEGDVAEGGATVTMRVTRPIGLVDTFA